MPNTEQLIESISANFAGTYSMFVDDSNQLREQSYDDIDWYQKLYSLRKLGYTNVFNLNPELQVMRGVDQTILEDHMLDKALKDTNKTKNFYAFFSATDANVVFAAMSLSGRLIFVRTALKLLEVNPPAEMENLFRKTFEYAKKISDVYLDNAGNGRGGHTNQLMKNDLIAFLLSDLCQKLGSGYFDFKNNIKMLGNIIENCMRTLFRDEGTTPTMYQLLLNQSDMLRTVVCQFMKNQEARDRKAVERGILLGSKFFTAFQRAGYIYEVDTGKWEKDVNHTVEFCLWHKVLYKIPEKYQVFKVERLVFDPSHLTGETFVITAKAVHPNVGTGGQVCIGNQLCEDYRNLMRHRQLMTQEYVNFLVKVEEALKIINFDSSYYSFDSKTGKSPSSVLIRANACDGPKNGQIKGSIRRV